jgi:DNA-directed RNA polymerase II subunit RPB2
MNYFEDTWHVLDSYFKQHPYFLTKHHLDSYNNFVSHRLKSTIKALNPIYVKKKQDNGKLTHEIEVFVGGETSDEIYINKPTIVENDVQRLMFPNEARLKDFTYQSEIFANIVVKYTTTEGSSQSQKYTTFSNVKIGALPIMLHSRLCMLHDMSPEMRREMGECKWDHGGYFIVDGKEKVIVAQERIATNRIFINKSKDPKYSYEGLIRCTSEENPLFPKVVMFYVNKTKVEDPFEQSVKDDKNESEDSKETEEKKNKRIHNSIVVKIPYCSQAIPLFTLFRALGVESDEEIIKHILYDLEGNEKYLDFLMPSIIDGSKYPSQEDCLSYMANFVEYKSEDTVKKILTNDLFANIGSEYRNKSIFLGHIVLKLINNCLGVAKETDRDSYVHKRVDISGFLIGNIFRDYYNQFRNVMRSNIDNQYLYGPWRNSKNVESLINPANMAYIFKWDVIENGMKKSLKGMWGKSMVTGSTEHMKQGLVQDLSRISYLGFLSHLRRVSTPIDPTSKVVAPHHLHCTQWGIMCPCESPDGGSIGLLKNFAIMCHVTFDTNPREIATHLMKLGMRVLVDVNVEDINRCTKVLINSNLVGIVNDAKNVVNVLKLLKLNNIIHPYTSVSWNVASNEIHVLTEAGRCCRPVYVVHKGKLLINEHIKGFKDGSTTWDDFFKPQKLTYAEEILEKNMSPIEFLDVEETSNALIAMDSTYLVLSKRYTHCEIHPSTILSVLTQNIPLCQHNQAPRNIFSGAQGKQAIGIYATNFNDRIDTMSYVLHYPQKSLINTRYMEYMHNNDMPNGENLIVAIATYTGYNQEDSIIINKNSIQRGCFNLTYFKNMIEKEEKDENNNNQLVFRNTIKMVKEDGKDVQNIRFGNYNKIDDNGLPKVNSHIKENDVIFGRCDIKTQMIADETSLDIFNNKVKSEKYSDRSVIADKTVSGIIDKVFVYVDDDNNKTCKVRFRKVRMPELGDKLCSRTAQKGVIGMIIPQENMPFNKDGIVPDIIINPHAFPTRMTLGHLLECLIAKAGVNVGTCIDGTPFNNNNYDDVIESLEKKFGLEKHGNEILYNGFTGHQMECSIFFGPTYYERLKHMVADKINYRTVGPITNKTRQPTKGRGNGGGLRIGEMEKDSILSHGAISFLKESLMERSDIYEFKVDEDTGFITNKENIHTRLLKAPCAFRLLMQEIAAMGVKPQLLFHESDNVDDDMGEDAEVDFVANAERDDDDDDYIVEESM